MAVLNGKEIALSDTPLDQLGDLLKAAVIESPDILLQLSTSERMALCNTSGSLAVSPLLKQIVSGARADLENTSFRCAFTNEGWLYTNKPSNGKK